MIITAVESWKERLPLIRPYTIAFKRVVAVNLFFTRIVTDTGMIGLGSAAPTDITGETSEACYTALAEAGPDLLKGMDPRQLRACTHSLKNHLRATPAARAALDMALYDLFARHLDVPLVDVLGRCHDALPTSITIGIKNVQETLSEAEEYVRRGFWCLKVKLGHNIDEDTERLHKLREQIGDGILIRVDANQGYTPEETLRINNLTETLQIELIEQPLPARAIEQMRHLPAQTYRSMAADESLHTEKDAIVLAQQPLPFGIFNIKLMKCGGITSGLAIADIARDADLRLMWGCMDESVVSIAAALHTAYACPATRFLDLDGSFDLSRDAATGGFAIREGRLHLLEEPGLGARIL